MSEEIKRKWDESEVAAVRLWYESSKGFDQIDKELNQPCGTLYKIVNGIPNYRGTRCSVGKWLRSMEATALPVRESTNKSQQKKRKMSKTSLSDKGNDKIELQFRRELDEAQKKIARLEAQRKKDDLRREFLEEQLVEYRKLVKPSQSKKSNTK